MDGKRIAIVFDSQEGQTARIAEVMASRARKSGLTVDLFPTARTPGNLAEYDGVIVGGSVHAGQHGKPLVRFVQDARASLERLPSAFFSVSLFAAVDDEQHRTQAEAFADAFESETGWHPRQRALFAGALKFSEYGFLKRMLMKAIASKEGGRLATSGDHEYTDWNAVDAFVDEFVRGMARSGPSSNGSQALEAARA